MTSHVLVILARIRASQDDPRTDAEREAEQLVLAERWNKIRRSRKLERVRGQVQRRSPRSARVA